MNIGCVIGRFQVETLHNGHRYLINNALRNHKRVIVFVGVAPIVLTRHDPLDYPTRERMIRQEFPDVITLPLYDCSSDETWSKQLDTLIKTVVPNVSSAVLYGGRGSFVPHYCGQHKAIEVDSEISYQSGTEQRKEIGKIIRGNPDFRAGIIYATQNYFPYVKMTVDIALIKREKRDTSGYVVDDKGINILLGRKPNESKWRLPGGFVDPTDKSLEDAACRELKEETSVYAETKHLKYIGAYRIDDWRFVKTDEVKIMTTLFMVDHLWDAPRAGDDLEEVRWHNIETIGKDINPNHAILLDTIRKELL